MPLSRITLASGRSIALAELRLSSTYGGLIEGRPSKRVNDFDVASRLRAARDAYPGRPVHLIPPERTCPEAPAHRSEPVEVLPVVACIGAFDSTETDPAHDSGWYFSALIIVWFQPTTDIPSDDNPHPALRTVPWQELAQDFED
ncbi:hypothetical protein [Streptomyces sp. NPDC004629]|uniref:hypothetical protein n=1 Tax=Streptomyces sp. NPDC004629 TaxID=3364705 RepID=UPI0036B3C42F